MGCVETLLRRSTSKKSSLAVVNTEVTPREKLLDIPTKEKYVKQKDMLI